MMKIALLSSVPLLLLSLTCLQDVAGETSGRGFGENIRWRPLYEGKKEAQESGRPIMIIIHKSWCGACKALKPVFAESTEIAELSRNFVMINLEGDEEPPGDAYFIDGRYVPRILFLDPSGAVHPEIFNSDGNLNYKYFYTSEEQVVSSMKEAQEKLTVNSKKVYTPDEL
ncbi:thioredoxin domain-containing protein 12 [Brachionichthys hirsutus]|uniref:thioredoxin domain-containing protein 12 n=1 Tax=Brachionichthys hirsutus TaxID=412623 RepID=UPI003604F8F3